MYCFENKATGGAFAGGTALGWSAQIRNRVAPEGKVGEYGFYISGAEWSWIASSVPLGSAIVCLFIGYVMQMIGRKMTMLWTVVPFTIGWALVIFPSNVLMLFIGRVLLGMSGGAFCVSAPTYTAETAQAEIRGALGTYFQLMLVAGIFFVYLISPFISLFATNLICGAIPLLFGATFVFMPESPMYLVSKGRIEEAAKSLQWLRGTQYDYTKELADLQKRNEEEKANKVSIKQALKRTATKRAFLITFGLMIFQQTTSIKVIIFFSGQIFESANTGISSSLATIVVGAMQVVAVFLSSLFVDRVGRRILLLQSAIAAAICTFALGGYFFAKNHNEELVAGFEAIPLVSVCVFMVLYSFGFGPVPYMMAGELFANDIKGVGTSLGGACNWALAFVISSSFTSVANVIGEGQTFWVFSALSVVATFFVLFIVPETKGKTLHEIQTLLGEKK